MCLVSPGQMVAQHGWAALQILDDAACSENLFEAKMPVAVLYPNSLT